LTLTRESYGRCVRVWRLFLSNTRDNESYERLRWTRVLTFLGGSNKLFYLYRLPTLRFAESRFFQRRTVAIAAAQRDITLVPRVIIKLGLRR